jgi:hypothetical protein
LIHFQKCLAKIAFYQKRASQSFQHINRDRFLLKKEGLPIEINTIPKFTPWLKLTQKLKKAGN